MSYYDEFFVKIDRLIKDGNKDKALSMINEELDLPYVPSDALKKLEEYRDVLYVKDDIPENLSVSQIEDYLFQDEAKQLLAVDALDRLNLREFISLVRRYFKSSPFDHAAALLIDSLISQEISDEFQYERYGVSYSFIPKYLLKAEESDGFLSALTMIEDNYMQDPSRQIMAKQLLYKECLLSLPVNYEAEEGIVLAHNIIDYIDKCFDA